MCSSVEGCICKIYSFNRFLKNISLRGRRYKNLPSAASLPKGLPVTGAWPCQSWELETQISVSHVGIKDLNLSYHLLPPGVHMSRKVELSQTGTQT